jgi:hypothetical protein
VINFIEAKYLKHVGNQMDVKVSIAYVDGNITLNIRDREFTDAAKVRAYLRRIGEEELAGVKSLDQEAAS